MQINLSGSIVEGSVRSRMELTTCSSEWLAEQAGIETANKQCCVFIINSLRKFLSLVSLSRLFPPCSSAEVTTSAHCAYAIMTAPCLCAGLKDLPRRKNTTHSS